MELVKKYLNDNENEYDLIDFKFKYRSFILYFNFQHKRLTLENQDLLYVLENNNLRISFINRNIHSSSYILNFDNNIQDIFLDFSPIKNILIVDYYREINFKNNLIPITTLTYGKKIECDILNLLFLKDENLQMFLRGTMINCNTLVLNIKDLMISYRNIKCYNLIIEGYIDGIDLDELLNIENLEFVMFYDFDNLKLKKKNNLLIYRFDQDQYEKLTNPCKKLFKRTLPV